MLVLPVPKSPTTRILYKYSFSWSGTWDFVTGDTWEDVTAASLASFTVLSVLAGALALALLVLLVWLGVGTAAEFEVDAPFFEDSFFCCGLRNTQIKKRPRDKRTYHRFKLKSVAVYCRLWLGPVKVIDGN